jgi:allantoin racemase
MIEDLVHSYGMGHRVVNVRTTPMCVLDFERDPERGMQMLAEEGQRAVAEDHAEAILLGCAGMADFANALEKKLGVPVIDGVVAAVKFAEAIVDLGKTTSKLKTYMPPEPKTFTGIFADFSTLPASK